jgi:3-methyladenine DNA glycosylase AlkC
MKAKIQSLLFLSEIFEKKALNNDFYIPKRIIKVAKILFAGIKESLLEEYPHLKSEIEEFSRHDPSGRLKYLKWQVNILNSGQAKPLEIQEVTDLFHRLGQNLKNKDLYSYKPSDFTDLRDQLFELKDKQSLRKEKVKRYQITEACEADTVYQSENFKVLLIKNKAASVHHGLDTRWCISMRDKPYFEDYDKSNIVFLFIINLQAIPRSPESKIALVYHRDINNNIIKLEIFDAADHKIDENNLNKILGEEAENILNITRSKAASVPKSLLAKIKSNEASSEEIKKAFIWAQNQDEEIREVVLNLITKNPNTPPEVLAQLAKDKSAYVREMAAGNLNTPPEVLAQLANDKSAYVRENVAINLNTPPEVLAQLANDKSTYVREMAARNPNTPPEILAQLSKDEYVYIRECVAKNHKTTPEILTQLSKDKYNTYIRESVAKNPNTPPEVLAQLAKDENDDVRSGVAENHNTPSEVLAQLAKDKSILVRERTAINPNTPPEFLEQLAKDAYNVRETVARNDNTPGRGDLHLTGVRL